MIKHTVAILSLFLLIVPVMVAAQSGEYRVTNTIGEAAELTQSSTPTVLEQQRITLLLQLIKLLQQKLALLRQEDPIGAVREDINQMQQAANPVFSVDLKPGMEHPDVKRLQQWLNNKGYVIAASGPGSFGNETTYYGPATQAAVKRYQEANRSEILSPVGLTSGSGLFLGSTRKHVNKVQVTTTSRSSGGGGGSSSSSSENSSSSGGNDSESETDNSSSGSSNSDSSSSSGGGSSSGSDANTNTDSSNSNTDTSGGGADTSNDESSDDSSTGSDSGSTTNDDDHSDNENSSHSDTDDDGTPVTHIDDTDTSTYEMVAGRDYAALNTTNTAWEFCSQAFSGGCDFEGRRQVRYGNPNSRWVVKEYFDGFPGWECSFTAFETHYEEDDYCEVTAQSDLGTLDAPLHTHSNFPTIDLTKIPIGSPGKSTLELVPTADTGDANDIGAFRVPCRYSHMAFNDPIVYPGESKRSHLHAFFGNTAANAYSTYSSLLNHGNSTCPGGIANRSAYWVPALIDTTTNAPMVPTDSIWYYKTSYRGVVPSEVQILPDGLRMITGDAAGDGTGEYHWQCSDGASYHSRGKYIPSCNEGEDLTLSINFPQCWDGVNLDSADHISHMAFPINGCPDSHPVALPELSLNISYHVGPGDDSTDWRLSSDRNDMNGGHSAHADFWEAWNKDIKTTFTEQCLQKSKDCHAYILGDGTRLGDE